MQVYCDTNVYDGFLRLDFPAFSAFKELKRSGVRFLGSAEVLSEITANANKPDQARTSLRLVEELCSPRCFLKAPDDLVADEVRAFLSEGNFSPFIARAETNDFLKFAADIIRSGVRFDLRERDKQQKKHSLEVSRSLAVQLASDPALRDGPFAQWWEHSGPHGVSSACRGLNLSQEDHARVVSAIDRLPALRTIAVGVLSAEISWMRGIKPDRGYEFDLKHAVLASQADVFLTDDASLLRTLAIGRAQLPYKLQRPTDFLDGMRRATL